MCPSCTLLRAGCKINLYLRVGRKRPDGYHEIDTLFLPLSEPHDLLEIVPDDSGRHPDSGDKDRPEPRVDFSTPGINPESNTLTRAYAWYAARTGFTPRLRIRVEKNIPHGAGLGGGSSDAAALLRHLQEKASRAGYAPLDRIELLEGSAEIGADVPFFLFAATARATGIGERLVPAVHPFSGHTLVLVCPELSVSTAWAFGALDALRGGNSSKKISALSLTAADHQAIPSAYAFAHDSSDMALGNDFEDLVFAELPVLAVIRARLYAAGAALARMSGTGSSLFALFRQNGSAEEAAKTLASDGHRVYVQQLKTVPR